MAQLVRKVTPLALAASVAVWATHCAGNPVAPAVGDNSPSNKDWMARFNMSWLMQKQAGASGQEQ